MSDSYPDTRQHPGIKSPCTRILAAYVRSVALDGGIYIYIYYEHADDDQDDDHDVDSTEMILICTLLILR